MQPRLLTAAEALIPVAYLDTPPVAHQTRAVQAVQAAALPLAPVAVSEPRTELLLAAVEKLSLTVAAMTEKAAAMTTAAANTPAHNNSNNRPARGCYNCSAPDHFARNCPKPRPCPRCQEVGHRSADCTAPAPVPKSKK